MDAVAKAMKAMVEQASDDCEHASAESLEAWAASDTLMAVFAQRELVFRDQKRTLEALEANANG